jgi:hypothetical protein
MALAIMMIVLGKEIPIKKFQIPKHKKIPIQNLQDKFQIPKFTFFNFLKNLSPLATQHLSIFSKNLSVLVP